MTDPRSLSTHPQHPQEHHKQALDRQLAAAQDALGRIRARLGWRRALLEILMAENDDISADLDIVQTAVANVAPAIVALRATITDLQSQIAAGPPGLTADQAAAIHARFQKIASDLQAAIAPAVPSTDTGTSGSGTSGT